MYINKIQAQCKITYRHETPVTLIEQFQKNISKKQLGKYREYLETVLK
jgi:hypothetical protein